MRSRLLSLVLLFVVLNLIVGCGRSGRAVPAANLLVVHETPDDRRVEPARAKSVPVQIAAAEPAPTQSEKPAEGFAFPKDGGGQELAKTLPAGVGLPLPTDAPSMPRLRTPPTSVANPTLAMPSVQVGPVLLPPPIAPASARPGKVQEELPLISYLGSPALPATEPLSTNVAVRIASPDVNQPLAPPTLGGLTPDRVALDDPTSPASREAALAAVPPVRTSPAPFQKNNLPDPYENRLVGRLRTPPPEEPTPTAASPRLPKP